MKQSFFKAILADELSSRRKEVNQENRLAVQLLAIVGLPLSLVNVIVQLVLANKVSLIFFIQSSWVFLYFAALLLVERKIIPKDFNHATALLYIVEAPIMICSILLGSFWDTGNQAVTFFLFLMAMPTFVLDRPIRVVLISAGWVALFLACCYAVKPPDIFARDIMHAFEFFFASIAVANVVIRVRMISLERLSQAQYHLEHDELTDMRNRRSLEQHADEYLGESMAIVLAELDQLSMYNDLYGHDVGTRILEKFAAAFSGVFGKGRSYRYGGNEMLGTLEGVSEQSCLNLIEECREKLRDTQIDDLKLTPTFAAGYALGTPTTNDEFNKMVQLADIRSHKASNSGRGQTVGGPFDEAALRDGIIESNIVTHVRAYETNMLTGLPSMSVFVSRSDEALASIVDMTRNPMIGFVDLPRMKAFNGEFGYAQGDELIAHVANLLRDAFPGRLLCCITGCQFGVMCYADEIDAGIQAVSRGLQGYKEGFPLDCRAGFAKRQEDESAISLIDKARIAERSIHGEKRVLYRFYDEKLDEDVKFREYIIAHLDEAIERGFLEVYYQPIINATTREICNEEALSRWNDPKHGLLTPYQFIPPLEESHRIYKLSLYVVKQILADFDRKAEAGLSLVPVSVNLSRYDFEECDMVKAISELVDESGYSRDMIRIEITESAFMKNQELLKREVARFRENGFQVWMDDFGSEYSTLNLLQDIDIDLLKIDMEFMRSSSNSGKNLIIVSSIIDMAEKMDVVALVEGVETEEHLEILRDMGCEKLQGYLFSKPLPLDQILEALANDQVFPFKKPTYPATK